MNRPTSRSQVRIIILEDHVLFAESLELALTVEGYDVRRTELPSNGSTPSAVLAAMVRQQPRIVLLDLDLGHFGDGIRFIGPLASAGINVVVVTANSDRVRWVRRCATAPAPCCRSRGRSTRSWRSCAASGTGSR